MFIETVYASEAAVEVTEKASSGLLASLGIDLPLFIFQLINFAIVVAILWFLILKPLTKTLAERQKIVDKSLADAQAAAAKLNTAEEEKKAMLIKTRAEAEEIMARAEKQGELARTQAETKAKEQAEKILAEAKKVILEEKNKMLVDLKNQTVDLVTAVAEKILAEKMTEAKDKKMIEEQLKKI
jgi:F-type H+-transporting ATPase subunit b